MSDSIASASPGKSHASPLASTDLFTPRHIGPSEIEIKQMLEGLGLSTVDDLIDQTVPSQIRSPHPLQVPGGWNEHTVLTELKAIAARNQIFRSFIGMGYSNCITPPVIQRNVFENPGWYTPYTPYQAEIAQGRLESLLNFQSMIADLTGLEIANASLLDESTAAAEAMTMCHSIKQAEGRNRLFIANDCHPQTINVVQTRAKPLGLEVVVGPVDGFQFTADLFAVLLQYPTTYGAVFDYSDFIARAHSAGALAIVAADLLSLTLLRPPGEFGADVAVGSAQRFGVPLGYGGPHAAFFATRNAFKREMPGRLIGVSKDSRGRPALRLSLQTREQHIRREKATSNICTAQALLANMAAFYAVYHGPHGLRKIARRIHALTFALSEGLRHLGHEIVHETFFDTLCVRLKSVSAAEIIKLAELHRMNFRRTDSQHIGVSLDETTSERDLVDILAVFNQGRTVPASLSAFTQDPQFPAPHARTSPWLEHPIFNRFHSETEMMRYIKRLETRDLSLTTSMIPLGSCTMKLNAAAEMLPVSWPEFSQLHPFAPLAQTTGYQIVFRQLEQWLAAVTGFSAVSLQPNAGSAGELAGLLIIREFLQNKGEAHRKVCLIPTSAHGTNPASAVMAGMTVVAVACDANGNVDLADLRAKAESHRNDLAALMVTYPSTHGVFEESIRDVCEIVHAHGGQVYMDGANMNAQVGLCSPGDLGADVCHLNLHKTFCIPHGGGGPGMGPIGVAEHLVEFLPGHPVVNLGGENPIGAIAAAPWGSASILLISWVYISLMGGRGLSEATKIAILNANYIARRLDPFFPVLYRGKGGFIAHECIVDLRKYKAAGIEVEDVAKRLMDYGFHAPTVSFPVPGTMMIEPTESESKEELDRFCEALIAIHGEIKAIESGAADRQNNVLKNAPHTADMIAMTDWNHPYTREQAAFPAPWLKEHKFWPFVGRIDNVHGDRNLVCSCVGMDAYTQ